jgi:hypothetical protein
MENPSLQYSHQELQDYHKITKRGKHENGWLRGRDERALRGTIKGGLS